MNKRDYFKIQTAATIVEIMIFLPIFLLLIGSVFLLSIYLNSTTALSNSMSSAVRLAITRGNPELMGQDYNQGSLQTVDSFISSGNFPPDKIDMIASNEFAANAVNFYNTNTQTVFGVNLADLPKEYLYSLVFAIQHMKLNVGSFRYPCDAKPENNPGDFAGCFQCLFINPNAGENSSEFLTPFCNPMGPDCVPKDRLAFYCEYTPDNPIISMIAGIFNFLSIGAPPQLTIKRQVFYNLKEYNE